MRGLQEGPYRTRTYKRRYAWQAATVSHDTRFTFSSLAWNHCSFAESSFGRLPASLDGCGCRRAVPPRSPSARSSVVPAPPVLAQPWLDESAAAAGPDLAALPPLRPDLALQPVLCASASGTRSSPSKLPPLHSNNASHEPNPAWERAYAAALTPLQNSQP